MYVGADGERVWELREASNATAGELAERAGIALKTLRRVEGNRGPVRVAAVYVIGRALEVDPRSFAKAVSGRERRAKMRAKQA